MLTDYLRANFKIRITNYYKITVVAVDAPNNKIKLKSDTLVIIPLNSELEFLNGSIKLTNESLVPNYATGSVDHPFTLTNGETPLTGHCTSFNDPMTGSLKQYSQTTVLSCSMRRIHAPVPEGMVGVDHNALRLRGRVLTEYDGVLKPGMYDAEADGTLSQQSRGKFQLDNNISDSIEGHEEVLGTKIQGWFQGYLIKT